MKTQVSFVSRSTIIIKNLLATLKLIKKVKIMVMICPFQRLQNNIENQIKFSEELNWAYRKKYKSV